MKEQNIALPSENEFRRGVQKYRRENGRDHVYWVATELTKRYWGDHPKMADALGVLLQIWNQPFYRFGGFAYEQLEACIKRNFDVLSNFRERDISSLTDDDKQAICRLFSEFLDALKRVGKKGKELRSPVAVAKGLHLLAPRFLPLWDRRIACGYSCFYGKPADPGERYTEFCEKSKLLAGRFKHLETDLGEPILRLVDEYNYATFTIPRR